MASATVQDDVNMSLDDLIKKRKLFGGRGRRGAPRGRGGAPAGGSSRGGPAVRRGGLGGSRGGAARGAAKRTYQPEAGDGSWQHDKFSGASSAKRGRFGEPASGPVSNKLIISNLDYGVSDNDIEELFREFGTLRRSAVHYDRSGRSLGTAEVVYANARDAQRALTQYNGVPLDGRSMRIQFASQTSAAPPAASPPARAPSFRGGASRARGGPIRSRGSAQRGRGAGAGAGAGAQRGRGGRKPQLTKEDLDRQMDEYNAQAQQPTTV